MSRVLYEVTGVKLDGELLTGVQSVEDTLNGKTATVILTMFDGSQIVRRGDYSTGPEGPNPWSRVGPVELLMRRAAL